MKLALLTLLLTIGFLSFIEAQLVLPFKPRFQVTQKGGIVYLANVSVSCSSNPNTSGGPCQTATSEVPSSGTGVNNNFNGKYVDVDGNASTFMSSSDSLNLQDCSNITWAGLYWSGLGNNTVVDRNKAKIKVNNGAYQQLTADTSYLNTVGYASYHSFKEITSIVQTAGTKARFTIADIPFINNNATNNWGGWMIVVVYGNQLEGMKQLTVFDGLASISGSTVLNVPITGFLTPPTGPVNFQIGNYVLDGDRSFTGDRMEFKGAASFIGITDGINPATDVMNSTVSYKGVLTPHRIPNLNNTLGLDADIFEPNNATKNYIGNSATSATLKYTTGGETYLVQEVSTAIDVYEPDLRLEKKVTSPAGANLYGATVNPGDTLVYTIRINNIGSDASLNTFITDSLSKNANYVPGSLKITFGPGLGNLSDASGDDRGEYTASNQKIKVRVGTGGNSSTGGKVVNSPAGIDSTVITFRAVATKDCFFLACSNKISNRASGTGTGEISGNTKTVGSNPNGVDIGGCPISGSTFTFVNVSGLACTVVPDTTIANICPTSQTFSTLYTRPGYTTFVNSTFDTVTTAADPGIYYAFKTSYAGCTDTVMITVTTTDCSIGVGSGGAGGIESYSLGNIIAKRTFEQTHQGSFADPNYEKMKVWNPKAEKQISSNSTSSSNGILKLADLVPKSFNNTKLLPFITTPIDLLKFTNAKEILAVDYVETQIPRAVSFATRTTGEVYNHTKPICDRLKGAQLLKVSLATVDGIELLTYTIRNADRKTEYAVSFTAGQTAGKNSMRIQSNWFSRDILNDDNMYNFQLWAETPELLNEMIGKVFVNLKKSAKIEGVSIISMPDAYIKSGKRDGGNLLLTIVNNTNQTTGYFDYAGNNNEQASAVNKKIPFNMQANAETSITIPVGDALEANISMFIGTNSLEDLVYLADGTWGVDFKQNNTRIGKFNVYNDPNRQFKNEFPLLRNVELNAVTNDFVTVYKSLSGGGADKNLSAFNAIKFTGAANSSLRIVLVKKSVTNWTEQYNYILPISATEKEYIIPLSAFTSSAYSTTIKPTDLVQIVFSYEVGRPNATLNASIKNASFIKAEFPEAEDPTMKVVSVFPNPANGMFKVSFKSAVEIPMTMRITDISTGKPIFNKSFISIKGENLIDVDLTNRLINKQIGIINIEGGGTNYLPSKIVIGLD